MKKEVLLPIESVRYYFKNWMNNLSLHRRKNQKLNRTYEEWLHPKIVGINFVFSNFSALILLIATFKEIGLANTTERFILFSVIAFYFILNFILGIFEIPFLILGCCCKIRKPIPPVVQVIYVLLHDVGRNIAPFVVGALSTQLLFEISTGLSTAYLLLVSLFLIRNLVTHVFILIPLSLTILTIVEVTRISVVDDKLRELFLFLYQFVGTIFAGLIATLLLYYREKVRRKIHYVSFFLSRIQRQTRRKRNTTNELIRRILPLEYTSLLTKHLEKDRYLYKTLFHKEKHKDYVYCQIDLVNFCVVSGKYSSRMLVKILDFLYSSFDSSCDEFGFTKIKTEGDAFICINKQPYDKNNNSDVILSSCLFSFDLLNSIKKIYNFLDSDPLNIDKNEFQGRVGCCVDSGTIVLFSDEDLVRFDVYGRRIKKVALLESNSKPNTLCVGNTIIDVLVRREVTFFFDNENTAKPSAKPNSMPSPTKNVCPALNNEEEEEEEEELVVESMSDFSYSKTIVRDNSRGMSPVEEDHSENIIINEGLGIIEYFYISNTEEQYNEIYENLISIDSNDNNNRRSRTKNKRNLNHLRSPSTDHSPYRPQKISRLEMSVSSRNLKKYPEVEEDEVLEMKKMRKKNPRNRNPKKRKNKNKNRKRKKKKEEKRKKINKKLFFPIKLLIPSRFPFCYCSCCKCFFLFLWKFFIFQFPKNKKFMKIHLQFISYKTLILSWIVFLFMIHRGITITIFNNVDIGITSISLTFSQRGLLGVSFIMYSFSLLVFTIQYAIGFCCSRKKNKNKNKNKINHQRKRKKKKKKWSKRRKKILCFCLCGYLINIFKNCFCSNQIFLFGTYLCLNFWYLVFDFCMICFNESLREMNMWFAILVLVIYERETYFGIFGFIVQLIVIIYLFLYYTIDGTNDFYGLFAVPLFLVYYYIFVSWKSNGMMMKYYQERVIYESQIKKFYEEEEKNYMVMCSILPSVVIQDFVSQFREDRFLIYRASGCVCFVELILLENNKNKNNNRHRIATEIEIENKNENNNEKKECLIESLNRMFKFLDSCCVKSNCQKIRTSSNKYISICADLFKEDSVSNSNNNNNNNNNNEKKRRRKQKKNEKILGNDVVSDISSAASSVVGNDFLYTSSSRKISVFGNYYQSADEKIKRKEIQFENMSKFSLMVKKGLTRNFQNEKEEENEEKEGYNLYFRVGFCFGNDFIAGIIGKTGFSFDILGKTVNLASRCSTTNPEMNQIQFTGNDIYEHVKDYCSVKRRGMIFIKGFGDLEMYLLDEDE